MRRQTIIPSLAVLAVVAAGCGTDAADDAGTDAGTDATDEPVSEEEDGGDADGGDADGGDADGGDADGGDAVGGDAVDADPSSDDPDADQDPDASEPEGSDPDAGSADAEPAQLRSPEGLIDQLRTHVRNVDAMPDEFEPGATDWRSFEVPEEVRGVQHDTPGGVVMELASALDADQLGTEAWETTVRVLLDEDDPDLAYGAVLSWGFLDDSVEGRDVRITLTRTDDERWEAGGAEERNHCMRGVTDDGELCV